ncbi:hypothetical protein, partial [Salmonella sp. s54925]|uniref:hypothetical protein n=1 Tax=Salmonella sp. s54925 TaxID=3159674 RepID=UPI00397EB2E8
DYVLMLHGNPFNMVAKQRAKIVAVATLLYELEEIEEQKSRKKGTKRWWDRQITVNRIDGLETRWNSLSMLV